MTKKVIAIISVLKPIDDSRNFEKLATTIGNTNKYEINIIGFSPKKIPSAANTIFYPIFNFQRLGLKRFTAPIKTFRKLLKVKPELIIVTCADLLMISALYKIIFGAKIIYDVQENYYRNILYSGAYPLIIKFPLAWGVRAIENLTSPFVDNFILAEKIYNIQLRFTSGRSIGIENKAVIPKSMNIDQQEKEQKISLLYCGTISSHYGIFEAVELIQRLSKSLKKSISLKILGYASQSRIRQKIKELSKQSDNIKVLSIDKLVPHNQIIEEMINADFCILPYQRNKSTEGRIPTKLFECLALERPVIINDNDAWNDLIVENNAGIIYDFAGSQAFPVEKLHQAYYGQNRSELYKWENNSLLLTETIKGLIG